MHEIGSEAASRRLRIMILDDHTLFRDILARDLARQEDFEIVGTCSTVQSALDMVAREVIDVVLLDVDLGQEQGGEFLRRATGAGYNGKVLLVTAGIHSSEAVRLARMGAAAVFRKHEPADALPKLIRDVVAGRTPRMDTTFETDGDDPPLLHRPLSTREAQVLRLVFEGLSNKEIATRLSVTESLVKEVIQRLFQKVGVRTRGQLVRAAIEKYWDEIATGS